jgi:hypothetical protein
LFGLKLRLELIVVGLFFDGIFESFMNGIFAEHVGLDLLDLFEDCFFIFVIIFVEFIAVGLDSISDKV